MPQVRGEAGGGTGDERSRQRSRSSAIRRSSMKARARTGAESNEERAGIFFRPVADDLVAVLGGHRWGRVRIARGLTATRAALLLSELAGAVLFGQQSFESLATL